MPRRKSDELPPGITRRPSGNYQAQAYSVRDQRTISKTFPKLAPARAWKRDTERALSLGQIVARETPTLRVAATAFLTGITDGTIRTRSRERYKPSTISRYRRALNQHLFDEFGATKLHDVQAGQIERLIGRLQAKGLSANSVRNAIVPLQAIYRWAIRQELVAVDPTVGLQLPLDRSRRDRFASPDEVELLLATLDECDRPLWATAFYAGLRRGELMALRWTDVDLAGGVIRGERSHDPEAGVTGATKTQRACAVYHSRRCCENSTWNTACAPTRPVSRWCSPLAAWPADDAVRTGRSAQRGYISVLAGAGTHRGSPRSRCTSAGTRMPR